MDGAGVSASAQAIDQAGKAAAGAEIDPGPRLGRQIEELERIGDVARPELRDGRARDQIGRGLPAQQQLDEAVEPRECFT